MIHPAIIDSAAVGVIDDDGEEIPKAFVTLDCASGRLIRSHRPRSGVNETGACLVAEAGGAVRSVR